MQRQQVCPHHHSGSITPETPWSSPRSSTFTAASSPPQAGSQVIVTFMPFRHSVLPSVLPRDKMEICDPVTVVTTPQKRMCVDGSFSLRHFPSRDRNKFTLLRNACLSYSLLAHKTHRDFYSYLRSMFYSLCSTVTVSSIDAVCYLYFLLEFLLYIVIPHLSSAQIAF